MTKLPIVERLEGMATSLRCILHDKSAECCDEAATTITELVSALDDALNTNPGWVERAQAILSTVRGETK